MRKHVAVHSRLEREDATRLSPCRVLRTSAVSETMARSQPDRQPARAVALTTGLQQAPASLRRRNEAPCREALAGTIFNRDAWALIWCAASCQRSLSSSKSIPEHAQCIAAPMCPRLARIGRGTGLLLVCSRPLFTLVSFLQLSAGCQEDLLGHKFPGNGAQLVSLGPEGHEKASVTSRRAYTDSRLRRVFCCPGSCIADPHGICNILPSQYSAASITQAFVPHMKLCVARM